MSLVEPSFFGVRAYCNREVGGEQGECGERTEERMGVSAGGRDGVYGREVGTWWGEGPGRRRER